MYPRTPSSGGSQWSGASEAPSTPSQAPRSLSSGDFPSTARTPNAPLTPISSGSPGHFAPYAPSQAGSSNHTIAYGLMTPPNSPDKIARRQTDFHPMLDARARPVSFNIRHGVALNAQCLLMPAINHSVNRMVLSVDGRFTVDIVSRGVPTMGEFMGQLIHGLTFPADPRNPAISKGSLLGQKVTFAGLNLRSLECGVAFCDLQVRTGP
ncbi:hypothetical protein BD414DRAFT_423830 [Trametes punicea]|nr:hypothetical protein BD414DRAFT_423830 [Trametes punicea]